MAIIVRVPSTLNIEQLAQAYPYTGLPTKEKSPEYLYHICSILVNMQAKHGGWQQKNKGFMPLCAKYLRKIHADYSLYLDYLVSAGVLETDRRFIVGEKCTGYKFTAQYDGVELKEVSITYYLLVNNIRQQKGEIIEHHKAQLYGYGYLMKWYDAHKLKIDYEGALNWVSAYEKQNRAAIAQLPEEKQHDEIKKLINVCNSLKMQIERIDASTYTAADFSIDEFGHRLHGIFTYMIKGLRHFITYNSIPLVAIDIKNSQPYFSTLLLNKQFWRTVKKNIITLYEVDKELYKIGKDEGITMQLSAETLSQLDISTGEYKKLAASGGLYEFLMEKLTEKLSEDFLLQYGSRVASRDAIKKEVLRIMYSDNKVANKPFYETIRAFAAIFPNVARLFKKLKAKDYKLLPKILQRIESHILLKIVCKRIAEERPDLPIFTIHDSIVTTSGNEDYVKQVILEELGEKVGLAPNLDMQYWQPEKAYNDMPGIENPYICFEDIEVENNNVEKTKADEVVE